MENSASKWVAYLRSEKWVLSTFVFITIPLIIHTQHLILKVTGLSFDLFPYDEELYALFFALGFDLAMITFAINGRTSEATGLAFIVFLFNAFFLNFDYLYNINAITDSTAQIFIKVFISIAVAGTASWIVHSYVQFFNDIIGQREEKYKMFGQVESLKKQLDQLTSENKQLSVSVSESKVNTNLIDSLQAQLTSERTDFHNLMIDRDKIVENVKREMNGKASYVLGLTTTPMAEAPRMTVSEAAPNSCEYCNASFRTPAGVKAHYASCKDKKAFDKMNANQEIPELEFAPLTTEKGSLLDL